MASGATREQRSTGGQSSKPASFSRLLWHRPRFAFWLQIRLISSQSHKRLPLVLAGPNKGPSFAPLARQAASGYDNRVNVTPRRSCEWKYTCAHICVRHFTTHTHTNTAACMPDKTEALSLGFLFANFQVSLFLFCTSLSYVHITTLLKRAPFPKRRTLPHRKKWSLDKSVYTLLVRPQPTPLCTYAVIIKMATTNKTSAMNSFLASIALSYTINMKKQCASLLQTFDA